MAVTNKSNTLNWRDAGKELPEAENHLIPYSKYCLIIINKPDKPREIEKDFFINAVGKWGTHSGLFITHWIYLDEIPLPKE